MVVALFAFVGLSMGSFASAIAHRLPSGESWIRQDGGKPARSRCPACSTRLGLSDLIPVVSWVFLRGKCRHCGVPISPLYPALELLGGILAVLFFFTYGFSFSLLGALAILPFFLAVLVVLFAGQAVPWKTIFLIILFSILLNWGVIVSLPGFFIYPAAMFALFSVLLRGVLPKGLLSVFGLLSFLIAAWLPFVFVLPFLLLCVGLGGLRAYFGEEVAWPLRSAILSFLVCLISSLLWNAVFGTQGGASQL